MNTEESGIDKEEEDGREGAVYGPALGDDNGKEVGGPFVLAPHTGRTL